MNRELFIGAIDLSEYIASIRYHAESVSGRFPNHIDWTIQIVLKSNFSDSNAKQLTLLAMQNRESRPAVYLDKLCFQADIVDFNMYQLIFSDPYRNRVNLVISFESQMRLYTMRGRFGR